MSHQRLSPIATRSSSNFTSGEKASPIPDSIPEEIAPTNNEEKPLEPPAKRSRLSFLALDVTKSEWEILVASTCLKLLLFPA